MMKQIRKLRKDIVRKPRAIIKKYTERCRQSLSILHQNQPWRYSDLSRKAVPAFGKMRGLWKGWRQLAERTDALYALHKALAELKKAHRRGTGKGAEKSDSDSDEETAAAKKKKRDKKKKGKDGAKAEGKGE
jgi:hypothetical protein